MDILQKIKSIADTRGMTFYELSKKCGFSDNTVYRWYEKNYTPTLDSLNIVCEKGFNISLGEFLAEDCQLIPATAKVKEIVDIWVALSDKQRELVLQFIDALRGKK